MTNNDSQNSTLYSKDDLKLIVLWKDNLLDKVYTLNYFSFWELFRVSTAFKNRSLYNNYHHCLSIYISTDLNSSFEKEDFNSLLDYVRTKTIELNNATK